MKLVLTGRPLRTVLVVWNVALIGSAAINVAEIGFAKDTLDAGDLGFGLLVAASGVGLALGSFLSAPALGKVGLRRNYVGVARAHGRGVGRGGAEPDDLARRRLRRSAARPATARSVVCNRLLVQRGAPDQYRGRALATIMSSNYAVLGLSMAAAGVLTEVFGPRAVWLAGGVVFLVAALVALVMTRWLPITAVGGATRRWRRARSRPSRRSATGTRATVEAAEVDERRARAPARAHRDAARGDRGRGARRRRP